MAKRATKTLLLFQLRPKRGLYQRLDTPFNQLQINANGLSIQ